MGEDYMTIIISYIPSLVLIVGGLFFIKFKENLWNNPLNFIFIDKLEMLNKTTGKIWIIEGILFFILLTIFRPFNNLILIMFLYFGSIIVSFIGAYLIVRKT